MQRKLKIRETGDYFNKKTIPEIRLKGKWLQEAGFRYNEHVKVTAENGRIVIEMEA